MLPWADLMDFGVVHPLVYLETRSDESKLLPTLHAVAADPWFGAVEIAPIKDPAIVKEARALLSAAAMQVVHLPILPIIFDNLGLGSEDDSTRREAKARLQTLLDQAIFFGAPLAMIAAPKDPGEKAREVTLERFTQDVQELCDYADAHSSKQRLHLVLENFDRDVEKKRLIGPTFEAAAFAEVVGRDNFGLTVDLSHLPLLKETPAEALQAAAPHLLHVHIGNCVAAYPESPLYGDFHPRFGHPLGVNDVPEVTTFLEELHALEFWTHARKRLGVTPILSMELKPSDGESSEVILANGKRVFAQAWAQSNGVRIR